MNDVLEKFPGVTVLVIGDLMLDRYWWGNVDRVSPEAPVPVIQLKGSSHLPGGAANVASNVAGLGGKALLLGAVGDDEEGALLMSLLGEHQADVSGVIRTKKRPTTVKTRIIAHNQQVVRIDREEVDGIAADELEVMSNEVSRLAANADIAVFSDYAKGLFGRDFCMRLITTLNEMDVPVVVDPKGRDYSKYIGAFALTPNEKEALAAALVEDEGTEAVRRAGRVLMDEIGIGKLLITRGEKGMMLFENSGKDITEVGAASREVFDVTGAGDTVIATLAVSLGAGAEFESAARIANAAAGEVIRTLGTSSISLGRLKKVLRSSMDT